MLLVPICSTCPSDPDAASEVLFTVLPNLYKEAPEEFPIYTYSPSRKSIPTLPVLLVNVISKSGFTPNTVALL